MLALSAPPLYLMLLDFICNIKWNCSVYLFVCLFVCLFALPIYSIDIVST